MHEPAGPGRAGLPAPAFPPAAPAAGSGSSRPAGRAGHRQALPVTEVGQRDHPDGRPGGYHPGRGADAALVTQAAHPGSRSHRTLARHRGPGGRPGRRQRLPHVVPLHLHPAAFVEETCRPHSATTGMMTSSPPIAGCSAMSSSQAAS